jgi:sulfate adenylyltransferase subunit 1
MGRIVGRGKVRQKLRVLPANRTAVAEVDAGRAADSASAGETVTIRLAEDVDVSRGDMFVTAEPPPPRRRS